MRMGNATAQVACDMERVFAPLEGRLVAPNTELGTPHRKIGRSFKVRVLIGALMAAGMLAAGYQMSAVPPVRTDRPTVARSLAAGPSAFSVGPAPASNAADDGNNRGLVTSGPTSAMTPLVESSRPLVPATAPSPAVMEAMVAQQASRSPKRQTRSTRSERRLLGGTSAVDKGRQQGCEPGGLQDECIYRDLVAADARLRRAYERAADAGLSASWLRSINARWERARDLSRDEPDRAIERYERLAELLNAELRSPR